MKLLTNKDYNSIFVYFPGIDFPAAWTLDNPAVYHYIKERSENRIIITNLTMQGKYLLFKAQGGIKYSLYASSNTSQYYSDSLKGYFYDYLNYSKDDVIYNVNFLKQFVIPSNNYDDEKKVEFSFNQSTYVLMKILPNNETALPESNKPTKSFNIYFNNLFLQFDYTSHWIRDWVNRVDGTTWDISGKLNTSNSLYCLNKNVGRVLRVE